MTELKLSQLRYLLAVQEHGSFSKAAERLFVSQPTLSVAIRDLEKEYDVALVTREKGRMVFTEDGQVMLKQARRILALVDELPEQFARTAERPQHIRIGFSPAMSKHVVPRLIKPTEAYQARHPGITISFLEQPTSQQLNLMRAGETDLIFGTIVKNNPADTCSRVLIEAPIKLCVGPNHPLANRDAVALDDFADEKLLTFIDVKSWVNTLIANWFESQGKRARFQFYTQISLVEDLILMGQGVALLPTEIYMSNDRVRTIAVKDGIDISFGVLWMRERPPSESANRYIRFVEKVLAS